MCGVTQWHIPSALPWLFPFSFVPERLAFLQSIFLLFMTCVCDRLLFSWCCFAKFLFLVGLTYSFCGHCQQTEISALVCFQWPLWYILSTWCNKMCLHLQWFIEGIQLSLFLMVSFWEKLLHLCQLQRLHVNKYNKGLCLMLMNGLLFHYCHLCVSAFLHMCLELYYRSECTDWINWNAVDALAKQIDFFGDRHLFLITYTKYIF